MEQEQDNKNLPGPYHLEDEDDDEPTLDWACPNCGEEYDDIDYEYQICHLCKFNNKQNK